MSWLYRFEAKGIQSWILATDRLKELRGGSTLIEQLRDHFVSGLQRAGGDFQYAAAGSGTATFSSREALERFAATWPMFVAQHAPGLELVQAWSEEGELREIRERLGEARNRPPVELPEIGPWVARAGRTGLAAIGRSEDGGLTDRATRARSRVERDALYEKLSEGVSAIEGLPPSGIVLLDDLQRYPEDEGVAVVHADGNAIGHRIIGLGPSDLRAFSDRLTAASLAAARAGLAGLVEMERDQDQPRFDREGRLPVHGRPIVAGGDDFTFVVRARAGLPLAERWLQRFAQEGAADGLSACAGVVFVRKGFPFHRAHEIAEDLCKRAKAEFRDHPQAGSRIAFERVTTSIYEEAHTPSWTLSELRALDQLATAGRAIRARGKLREWAAEGDPRRADQLFDRLAEVAEPEPWAALVSALAPFEDRSSQAAVRCALQWSRIHPDNHHRLWRQS